VSWITGINRDGWPTAIPIDRVEQISVDPRCEIGSGETHIDLRDNPTNSEVFTMASVTDTASLNMMLGALCRMVREKDSRSEERVD
jgi:hypothetical protein